MKKIVMTGGGTAGHVTPNIALMPALKTAGYDITYIGSRKGIEKELIEREGIPYHSISSGKLRRYFSLKNFTDPFRILAGFFQAKRILKKEKPDIIFSKGGFVSVPVVYAANALHIPVIIHESDMTPGLANRLASKKATHICTNFEETAKHFGSNRATCTGSPIRTELLSGDAQKGHEFTHLDNSLPVLLIIGGSLGSEIVNTNVRSVIDRLLEHFHIVHLCGKGKIDDSLMGKEGYVQYEYLSTELPHVFAMADVVISRAGANSICELLALKKPNLLVPLSAKASRGDQILNAKSFKKQGFSMVLDEEEMTGNKLYDMILELYKNRDSYIENMSKAKSGNSIETIMDLIKKNTK